MPKAVPPIQFISSNLHLLMQEPKRDRSAKRKLPSADVDDGQPVAKRLRTRIAKPKVPMGPPRKSTRLRNSANTAVLAQPGPAHQLDGAEETGPGGAEESVDVDANAVVDVETVAETQARAKTVPGPKKARRATKKLTTRKTTSARKRRAEKTSVAAASPNDRVEEAPQEAMTQPSPPSSGSVRIPARTSSSSPACAASLLASAANTSSATTAVGTPTRLEDDTRVNTPNVAEKVPSLELEKVDAKLTGPAKASARRSAKASVRPPAKAPERTSARIREKKVGAGSVQGA